MTEREYNDAEGVRRSDLWLMHDSPEKYQWAVTHPDTEKTPALIFGSMVHKLLLEPKDFTNEFVIAPEVDKRTKDGKAQWQAFLDSAEGKTVISIDDYAKAAEMAEKAITEPYVKKLLSGDHERAFFWVDEDTGENCKVRVDMLTEIDGKFMIADYKTTLDARTDVFVNRDMQKYGYALQAYMYAEGVKQTLGLDYLPDFQFVVQEKKPPYSVNVITVYADSAVMTHGQDMFREYIGTLHQCKETGYWWGPMGPFGEPNEAYLPGWIQMGEEDE